MVSPQEFPRSIGHATAIKKQASFYDDYTYEALLPNCLPGGPEQFTAELPTPHDYFPPSHRHCLPPPTKPTTKPLAPIIDYEVRTFHATNKRNAQPQSTKQPYPLQAELI